VLEKTQTPQPTPTESEEDAQALDKARESAQAVPENTLAETQLSEPGQPVDESRPVPTIRVNGVDIPAVTFKNNQAVAIELTAGQREGLQKIADWVDANVGQSDVTPFVLTGKAGTGKTTLIKLVTDYIRLAHPSYSDMKILTTSHKAGRVASMATFGNSSQYKTLASAFSNPYQKITGRVFLFDEVSMNEDYYFKEASASIRSMPVLPIFIGDIKQIPPVDGNKTSSFFESENKHELTEIVRFQHQGPIFKLADAFAEGLKEFDPVKSFPKSISDGKESVESFNNQAEFIDKFLDVITSEPDMSQTRIVTYSNNSIRNYVSIIRGKLFGTQSKQPKFDITPMKGEPMMGNAAWSTKKPLANPVLNSVDYIVEEDSQSIDTFVNVLEQQIPVTGSVVSLSESRADGVKSWPSSIILTSPVYSPDLAKIIAKLMYDMQRLPRKDKFNSSQNNELERLEKSGIYLIEPIYAKVEGDQVTLVSSEKEANIKVEPNIIFGYALTSHKAQGSTYKNVFVDEQNMSAFAKERKVFDRKGNFFSWEQNNMKYVGMSRASQNLFVYTQKPVVDNPAAFVSAQSPLQPSRQLSLSAQDAAKVQDRSKSILAKKSMMESGVYDVEGSQVQVDPIAKFKLTDINSDKPFEISDENRGLEDIDIMIDDIQDLDAFAIKLGYDAWSSFADTAGGKAMLDGAEVWVHSISPVESLEQQAPTQAQEFKQPDNALEQTQTLWLNYRDKMLEKNPTLTFAEFKAAVDKKGVEFIENYLKTCYK
jgi:hypothetical protein